MPGSVTHRPWTSDRSRGTMAARRRADGSQKFLRAMDAVIHELKETFEWRGAPRPMGLMQSWTFGDRVTAHHGRASSGAARSTRWSTTHGICVGHGRHGQFACSCTSTRLDIGRTREFPPRCARLPQRDFGILYSGSRSNHCAFVVLTEGRLDCPSSRHELSNQSRPHRHQVRIGGLPASAMDGYETTVWRSFGQRLARWWSTNVCA